MKLAVYNSRIPNMISLPGYCASFAVSLLVLLLFVPALSAADWSEPEQQLCSRILSLTGPGAFDIKIENRSSLSFNDVEQIKRSFLERLTTLGMRAVSAEAAAGTVSITLSEGLNNYIWIAEVRQGTNQSEITMVSLPRSEALSTDHAVLPMTLHKMVLWTSENRMLDVAVINGNPQLMIVLEADRIVLCEFQNGRWQQQEVLQIAHAHPWPRDLRGRIVLKQDHFFDAYLPGVFCRSSTALPLGLDCRDSDDPWPLGIEPFSVNAFFASTRNFFTGVISTRPGTAKTKPAPPFYSAAAVPRDKYTLWIFAGVDGQIHLTDGITDRAADKLGWGSDLSSLHTNCGTGWQILATGASNGLTDNVKAFEIPDREFIPAGPPLDVNGSITALWPDADGGSAIAILKMRDSEKYEADKISITCSH